MRPPISVTVEAPHRPTANVLERPPRPPAPVIEVPGIPGDEGPRGPEGPPGPQGPRGDIIDVELSDPGDLTLLFDNRLI